MYAHFCQEALEAGLKPAKIARREAEQREIAELRERIKVLERIATDANTTAALTSRRVADEIESLRDKEHS